MTDTQLTWIGIVSQAIPTITAILMVTVGNWYENRREGKNENNFKIVCVYHGAKIKEPTDKNYFKAGIDPYDN